MDIILELSKKFNLNAQRVEKTVSLMDEGNTIPFIARYRKEVTGSMDDQLLRELFDRLTYLRNFDKERERIRTVIEEAGALNEELSAKLDNAKTMSELEDIYLPFRPKRKTRASVARAKGLEPLAELILSQIHDSKAPEILAKDFLNEEVTTVEDAIKGAKDIISEDISFNADLRKRLRNVITAYGNISSTSAVEEIDDTVYAIYKEFSEPIKKIANHRVLAINRGEKEGALKVSVDYDKDSALKIIEKSYLIGGSACTECVREAIADSYTRLIFPSIEREIRNDLMGVASDSAIKIFSQNLHQLLMQPPLKGKTILGFDPGYRTGCKIAVVDEKGDVLDTGVIYPVPPHNKIEEAKKIVLSLVKKHKVNVFAIGNGTASHETETFAADLISENNLDVGYMVVSEAGASVYSASKLAAQEFPQFDVSLRSAVSIARRLEDPLAELVKIDPKAIGVGQYQHDMPQAKLTQALDGVVEQCVNMVGIDLNTASVSLLSHVAGINSGIAKNIVDYRSENNGFKDRKELLKVSKLGAKAFEQCAGFLRIPESKNLLDRTSVHPESYKPALKLIELSGGIEKIDAFVESKGLSEVAEILGIGRPTLEDIISEIQKPGRDPRDELPAPMLKKDIMGIENLTVGMELTGTVRNVIDFGAFVDIGVHEDGLVHISQICDKFIKHPSEVLKVGDIVKVKVISVDVAKKRIGLSMKQTNS